MGASFTALTVIVLVSVSDNAPPEPVLPWSFVTIVNVTLPFMLAMGEKIGFDAPAKKVLIFAMVPVNTMELLPEPVTVTLPPVVADNVPESTDKVTVIAPDAASTSAIDNPAKANVVSSFTLKLAGKVLTGASFTALTVMVLVSVSVNAPPEPVLPRSSVTIVKVTLPFMLAIGVKRGFDAPAKKALIFAIVPDNATELVPDPATVTPPLVVADNVPESTDKVTFIAPDPASTSAIDNPAKANVVSSFVLKLAGKVLTGASFTADTLIVTESESVNPFASVDKTVKESVPLKLALGV